MNYEGEGNRNNRELLQRANFHTTNRNRNLTKILSWKISQLRAWIFLFDAIHSTWAICCFCAKDFLTCVTICMSWSFDHEGNFQPSGNFECKTLGNGRWKSWKTEAKHKLENESIFWVAFDHCESKLVLWTCFHLVWLYPKIYIWRYSRKGLNSATNLLVGKE